MDKVKGSIGFLSDVQITADIEGLDAESKTLLRNREVLSVILRGVAEEYEGYSLKEIAEMIEPVFMQREVSPGRTNAWVRGEHTQESRGHGQAAGEGECDRAEGEHARGQGGYVRSREEASQVRGENPEFVLLNEKTAVFDLSFKARDPRLSVGDVQVSLHIDIEMQKSSKVPYPIEKRGLYYLARSLSAQLSLVTEQTDYDQLEKCYSIWICRDDIPERDRYSISFYGIANTKEIRSGIAISGDDLEKIAAEEAALKRAATKKTTI